MFQRTRFLLSAVMAACPVVHAVAAPLGTAFTYQGQLNDAGSPVDETADFQFRLYDAASAGNLIAGPVSVSNVDVIEGLFTASVDFGAVVFNGEARWLAIALRTPAGSGTFTTLTERQPLTAAPYSRFAANSGAAPWSGLSGIPAGFVDGIDNGSGDGFSLDAADGNPTDAVFVDNTGNVGVGTTAPQGRLDVRGGIVSQVASGNSTNYEMKKIGPLSSTNISFALSHRSNGTESWMYGYDGTTFKNFQEWDFANNRVLFPPDGNALSINVATGNVGVGTATPNKRLTVDGDMEIGVHSADYHHLRIGGGNSNGYIYGSFASLADGIHMGYNHYADAAGVNRIDNTGGQTSGVSVGYGEIRLATGGVNSAPVNRLVVDQAGTVHIAGTTRTGVLEITGADLAEKFPTSDIVEPGIVMAIDPCNPGSLCRASGAYNRAVAGVVSGANDFSAGAVLGNLPGQEDAPPIALSGRVYVWCDASNGAIQPGDLLTTSDTPGYAMKVTDYARAQGAALGKAMTSLESGHGLVLLLVQPS